MSKVDMATVTWPASVFNWRAFVFAGWGRFDDGVRVFRVLANTSPSTRPAGALDGLSETQGREYLLNQNPVRARPWSLRARRRLPAD